MMSGATYPHLVNDLWVRAEVFDEAAAYEELRMIAVKNSSLKGKSREEVGLRKFEEVEIRSSMMGVDVIITQKIITKLLRAPNSGRFVVRTKDNSSEADVIKRYLFEECSNLCSFDFGKVENMNDEFKILFKILINCPIPKEGSTDRFSWDHKHFIFYLKNEGKINLSSYIFNHLYEAIKDKTKYCKKNVPYARLLSCSF